MSIRPIDFQVNIPKISELSKVKSEEQHKSFSLYEQQSASFSKKMEKDVKQVYSQDKINSLSIKEKQKKEQESGKKNKKEPKDNLGSQKNSRSIIDIKV